MLLETGNPNGYVGKLWWFWKLTWGGKWYVCNNHKGITLLDFCISNNLAVANTFFKKPKNRFVTYQYGWISRQIDYNLMKRSNLKYVGDVNVIGGEEYVSHDKVSVADFVLKESKSKCITLPPKRQLWKLKRPNTKD